MKKIMIGLLGFMVLAIGVLVIPNKQISAAPADTSKDSGCFVRDANDTYYVDDECKFHLTLKRDEEGNLIQYIYQDKGSLPEGAVFPSRTLRFVEVRPSGAIVTEIITPSGQYSSSIKFRAP